MRFLQSTPKDWACLLSLKNNDMEDQILKMSFDPHTIEHLGVKMYSNIPNAIAELVANSYDAEAENVQIELFDDGQEKSIRIVDDGVGMDFEDVNNKFLRIGRKRRIENESSLSPNGKRKVTGKKGLGKLAFFGIGDTIDIITQKNGEKISFTLDWNEIINTNQPDYKPKFQILECDEEAHGTVIILRNLLNKSEFDKEGLAISLSKLFNLFDYTFNVTITLNDDEPLKIDDKLKYKDIVPQFRWDFPEFSNRIDDDYEGKKKINGVIISTEKPLKPGLRGITLFANGRLVNAPEFFGVSESSHGFSYFTGWLTIDFVDEWEKDVISTDRQSLNWDLPETERLRWFLKKIMSELERDWRKRRNDKKKEEVKQRTQVDLSSWYGKLPHDVQVSVEPIVSAVMYDSELSTDKQTNIVTSLHSLIPEYPYYHWRYLHPSVRDASYVDYGRKDFYRAVEETIKRYITEVQRKSKNLKTDVSLMSESFGFEPAKPLKVAKKYKKKDGSDFTNSTKENIERGQMLFSMGVVSGVRNPVAHEEITQLRDSGLFTEKDCLDSLSLLSHLFRRLDDA